MASADDFIVVDLETYDNICTAAIASIGAVYGNFKTRQIYRQFYCTIDAQTSKAAGLSFGKETLDWWQKQSPEARAALRKDNIPLQDALQQFHDWVDPEVKVTCWGMFDVPVLDHAFRKVGLSTPWKYWNTIDLRSIAELLDAKIDRSQGTHHNALDDAMVQAKFIINLLNPAEQ